MAPAAAPLRRALVRFASDLPLERDGFGLPVPSASHETVKPSRPREPHLVECGIGVSGLVGFQRASIQRGTRLELKPSRKGVPSSNT